MNGQQQRGDSDHIQSERNLFETQVVFAPLGVVEFLVLLGFEHEVTGVIRRLGSEGVDHS